MTFTTQTYDGLQAAEYGSIDEHLADLHVDRQAGQVVSQRGEEVVVEVTRADPPQQADGVADRLRLRGIEGAAQEVLRRPVLTLLQEERGDCDTECVCALMGMRNA